MPKVIEANPEAVARAAADAFAALLERASSPLSVALAGGSTPRRLYAVLARRPNLPWARARLFLGDERALPPDHADSNARMVDEALAAPLGLGPSQVILPDGGAPDLAAEAARYAGAIVDEAGDPPALDLVLLGMGGDGHTASLFPGEPAPSGVYAVTRAPADTAAARRLTLSYEAIIAAKRVWLLITGAGKAERLAAILRGDDEGPLARIVRARARETTWYLDEAAARGLGERHE